MKKVIIKADDLESLVRSVKNMGINSGQCDIYLKTPSKSFITWFEQQLRSNFKNIDFQVYNLIFQQDEIKAVLKLKE